MPNYKQKNKKQGKLLEKPILKVKIRSKTKHHKKIDKQISTSVQTINIDQEKIFRSIQNLITNAQQAMPNGGTIKFEVSDVERDQKRYLAISVSDTGVGIEPKNLQKIFDPLFTTKAKGIGLGLAITQDIVKQHHGIIEVKSQKDKGSTFTIFLDTNS